MSRLLISGPGHSGGLSVLGGDCFVTKEGIIPGKTPGRCGWEDKG